MSEEFEVHGPHEDEIERAIELHEKNDNFAGNIAVVTAILATLGALFSYEAGNTQAMAAMYKNDEAIKTTAASDQWNFYQAKSNKMNLEELAILIPGVDIKKYQAEIAKHKTEKEKIKRDAEALQAQANDYSLKSEAILHQHHRWASAMTALQIAISLAAISLLTRRKWLKNGVYMIAGVGILFAIFAIIGV